jgi:hypothetical protein
MLMLNTLSRAPNHGWGIAQHIRQVSQNALNIGEASLYPAKLEIAPEPLP